MRNSGQGLHTNDATRHLRAGARVPDVSEGMLFMLPAYDGPDAALPGIFHRPVS